MVLTPRDPPAALAPSDAAGSGHCPTGKYLSRRPEGKPEHLYTLSLEVDDKCRNRYSPQLLEVLEAALHQGSDNGSVLTEVNGKCMKPESNGMTIRMLKSKSYGITEGIPEHDPPRKDGDGWVQCYSIVRHLPPYMEAYTAANNPMLRAALGTEEALESTP